MKSDSLFIKCKSCGKDISKSASACPHCGAKQKKLKAIHWVGIVFGILILIGIVSSPDSEQKQETNKSNHSTTSAIAKKQTIQKPTSQIDFENVVTKFIEPYKQSKNELKKSSLRSERMSAISNTLNGFTVTEWVGKINDLSTNSEGKAILSIGITPDIEIKTWNNALSDISANTLIDQNTNLYNQLMELERGQNVKFSGMFFSSEDNFIQETSLTEEGSMINPEFLMKFSTVTPIN